MRHPPALPRRLRPIVCMMPRDFDQIEAAEHEAVRQIEHGHSFQADGMTEPKAGHNKIYSL